MTQAHNLTSVYLNSTLLKPLLSYDVFPFSPAGRKLSQLRAWYQLPDVFHTFPHLMGIWHVGVRLTHI